MTAPIKPNESPDGLAGQSLGAAHLLDRWEVQQHDMLRGWNVWVIYDEQRHADEECTRRKSESPQRDKRSWRVVKRSNNY